MHHLTKDEMRSLLQQAWDQGSSRDWLMVLTAYWHGLRASEVVGLRGHQVRDGYLTVQRLKGSEKTTQPLIEHPDPLFSEKLALESLAEHAGPDGRLFPIHRSTFWRAVQKYGEMAGIPEHKCHPHVFKHTIAMHTIRQAGIENVRQYLGHKSISSTGEYLKVDDDAASKAVAAAMGIAG